MGKRNGRGNGTSNGALPVLLPRTRVVPFLYANAAPETVDCLFRLALEWPEIDYERRSSDALIDRARSRAASDFLFHTDFEVLIMIDHDMIWEPGDIQHLAAACARTKGVVGGVYPKRNMGENPPIRFHNDGVYEFGSNVVARVTYVSTGFMAIHREVLEKMAADMPRTVGGFVAFFQPGIATLPDGRSEYLSEDWAFCLRASGVGAPVHADLWPRIRHVGEYIYRMIDCFQPPIPDRWPIQLTVDHSAREAGASLSTLVQHLSDFTRVPLDRIEQAMSQGTQDLAQLWHKYGPATPEEEDEWYRKPDVGRDYILDLVPWHLRGTAQGILDEIGDVSGKRVLDFGAGICTVAIQLALDGADVEYVEPNEVQRKFASYRASQLDANIRSVTEPTGEYDLIVCWHVLEHVAAPEAVVRLLSEHLAPGGRIVSQSDFHVDDFHPQHHEREDNGEGIWEAAGFAKENNTYLRAALVEA